MYNKSHVFQVKDNNNKTCAFSSQKKIYNRIAVIGKQENFTVEGKCELKKCLKMFKKWFKSR